MSNLLTEVGCFNLSFQESYIMTTSTQLIGPVFTVLLSIGGVVYSAGVIGTKVDHNTKDIERIEKKSEDSLGHIRKRIDEIYTVMMNTQKKEK